MSTSRYDELDPYRRMTTVSRILAVGVILFCFEIGFFLVVVPWSFLWENNLLFSYVPFMEPILLSWVVRAAVTFLGLLNFLIGVSEVQRLFRSSRTTE
jgi:hypothetical protein